MSRALELAEAGRGFVAPNPLVGAVVVRDGHVVGEGAHLRYGEAHAEVNALAAAGGQARGATIYVTLEPCNHYGKTPPCTKALIEAGVSEAVVALTDPFPEMQGKSYAVLEQAGITVRSGLMADEARRQNEVFVTNIAESRPFVTLKAATSLDGKLALASGESKWITGPEAREAAHALRGAHQAVMVGIGTVLADDPSLNCRRLRGINQPLRVILDASLRCPPAARVFSVENAAPTLLVHGPDAVKRREAFPDGAQFLEVPSSDEGKLDLSAVLDGLWERKIGSILVEGGATLLQSFLASGAYDKLEMFVAPCFLGISGQPLFSGQIALMAHAPRFQEAQWSQRGSDGHLTCYPPTKPATRRLSS